MQFCDECGSMMRSMGSKMVCTNDDCQHTVAKDEDLAAQYTSTEDQDDSDVIETVEGAEFEGKPTATDVHCKKCGHTEAWYTIKQTASADEPPTRFFKCKECGYRWRGYN